MRVLNCPVCELALYKRYEGYVCKNHRCKLYHKLNTGWVYRDGYTPYEENQKFFLDFVYGISQDQNKAKWLLLKKKILHRDNFKCKKCENSPLGDRHFRRDLQVHHIISRNDAPELTFDEENLITLCSDCHKEAHSTDKRHFK